MDTCAYLVNSTPKYYGILPLHFTLLKRYAPHLPFALFLATEEPNHPICKQVADKFGVKLIPLEKAQAGFLESRVYALMHIAKMGRFKTVMPIQEDFLLDRCPDLVSIDDAIEMISEGKCVSARVMPCPGPGGPRLNSESEWAFITKDTDPYSFTFQATVWDLDACLHWYNALCIKLEREWPLATTPPDQRRHIEIRANFAENPEGQRFFWEFFKVRGGDHIGWIRAGKWSNAVYLSPWPYRPTAIVQGKLEPWAVELGQREGVPIVL